MGYDIPASVNCQQEVLNLFLSEILGPRNFLWGALEVLHRRYIHIVQKLRQDEGSIPSIVAPGYWSCCQKHRV